MAAHVTRQVAARAGTPPGSAGVPVLAAKITAPGMPGWAVPRPQTTELIARGGRWCPLTVVTAPAGAGKTMALASWAAAEAGAVAWVSLDEFDNQPGVFWAYVVAALRRSGVAVPAASLAGRGRDACHVFVVRLAAALAAQDPSVTLVLDDFHLITGPAVLDGLDYVLRNAGAGLRLVVSARTDPLLRLHRYRLAGQLTAIGASDLAFTVAEAGLASDLTGKPVTLPAITSADPPQQAVTKLSKALGVTLPSDFGQITLVKSSDLAGVQRGVQAFDRFTLVLPLVTIILIALSLWLSVNRRRTLLQLAVGVSLLMIVERRVTLHEQSTLASGAHNPQVAQIILGDLLHGFFVLTAWVLGVALVVLVIAVLTGPYGWAVALRSWVKRTWRGIAGARTADSRGQVVTWMASHAAGLQLAGAVAAGILLLIVPVSWLSFLIIGVLLAAYEVYLQRIKPPRPDEAPPANQAGLSSGIGET